MSLSAVPNASDKSNLVETSLATITELVQVQNTAAPIMYTVPVSNIALNELKAEITKLAPESLSVTPALQETLDKMMPRMTKMEHTLFQMQANIPVPNFQYFQLPNLQTLLSLKQQRPFQTLLILNKTKFPCILMSYSLRM